MKNRLRGLRKGKDLNQTQIAAVLRISQRGYSKYETGENKIPPEVLLRLAPNRPAAGPGGCSWPPCAGNTA